MQQAKAFAATIGPLTVGIATYAGLPVELATLIGASVGAFAVWKIPNMVKVQGKNVNVMDVARPATDA